MRATSAVASRRAPPTGRVGESPVSMRSFAESGGAARCGPVAGIELDPRGACARRSASDATTGSRDGDRGPASTGGASAMLEPSTRTSSARSDTGKGEGPNRGARPAGAARGGQASPAVVATARHVSPPRASLRPPVCRRNRQAGTPFGPRMPGRSPPCCWPSFSSLPIAWNRETRWRSESARSYSTPFRAQRSRTSARGRRRPLRRPAAITVDLGHPRRTRSTVNPLRVFVAVGRVRSVDAAVVPQKGSVEIPTAPAQQLGQDLGSVADVRIGIRQVAARTPPVACVKRHHLHQADSSHRALRIGVEPGVLDQQDRGEESRVDPRLMTFPNECQRCALYRRAVGVRTGGQHVDQRVSTCLHCLDPRLQSGEDLTQGHAGRVCSLFDLRHRRRRGGQHAGTGEVGNGQEKKHTGRAPKNSSLCSVCFGAASGMRRTQYASLSLSARRQGH
jgi:hypothetical protein